MTKPIWLLGHDLSEHSDHVAIAAAKELQWRSGKLILLHVYQVPPTPLSFSGLNMETSYMHEAKLTQVIEQDSKRSLKKIAEQLKEQFPTVQIQIVLKTGTASDVILDVAKDYHVERIVVGSHCRSGLEHFFAGSVAEHVVKGSHIPVLVFKHQEC